jgi:dsDNA-specific endonuclease/ATPase MutS2
MSTTFVLTCVRISMQTYTFRLKGDKFPVLKLLRDKEEKLVQKGGKALDRELLTIQNEIDEVQSQIKSGLAQNVLSVSQVIDEGLDAVARLDVLFAKAAFGSKLDGAIPRVATEGRISIDGFLHPVLASADGFSSNAKPGESGQVVPIDLRLSSEDGDRALLISGPNGGGKTLSMKSFGLVCVLAKLGLPIPSSDGAKRPRVDFFDRILVNVGDQQSVMDGESTWTSTLNSCAVMIEEVTKRSTGKSDESYLVLLDELGSGTDPEAGGAIAQAILEEFMAAPACHIVATTHSPRLKALSYESSDYNCATVLLESDDASDYKRPSFRLEYGLIGESYALGAASRCTPALPESLLTRASQIMTESSDQPGTGSDYIRALTRSMEDQVERAKSERIAAEERAQDSANCRRAMICLAASYENHLARLEQRLEDCYQKLQQQDGMEDLELVGKTLSELRAVKKQILSQKELLSEKGLKLLPTSHELKVGESVVIVSGGEWDGTTMEVVADATIDENLGPTEVLVQSSSSFLAWDNMFSDDMDSGVDSMVDRPLIVHRHELAIWDYDSVWEDEEGNALVSATSVPDSRRRLNSLLSTLKTESPTFTRSGEKKIKVDTAFSSSRARKAANKGKGKKKRK